jgi:hypothetical protein
MPFGFWHKCCSCLRYVARHNQTGAVVDSQINTHIISISEWLSFDTLVVSF